MKKMLSVFLAFTMVFSVAMPALAENIGRENYEKAGKILQDLDLLVGDEKGNLRLEENLKRQHMVVMISRIYGEEKKASSYEGVNKYKDLKPKHRQDIPFITWATDKGLISGYPNATFGIDKEVTVQEYQSVLLRGLGYLKDGNKWESVPEMSNNQGIMDGLELNPENKMNRGAMAAMTLNALRQNRSGTKTSLAEFLEIDVPEELDLEVNLEVKGNSIHFEGQVADAEAFGINIKPISSNIEMKEKYSPIPLDKDGNFSYSINDLEVGKYSYRFQSGEKKTLYRPVEIDSIPFKFNSVTGGNFKEIHLELSHPVNKTLASIPSNYSTTAGNIENVRFKDGGKKIILSIDEVMYEGKKYQISASNIESEDGEKLELKSHSFEASDNEAPEIKSVKQLGEKGIRVYFSEPVKRSLVSNFKVDGKSVFGKAAHKNNYVTLLYHSPSVVLKDGDHKLSLSDIEDYSGKKLKENDFRFSIVEDNESPAIVNIQSTSEIVIVEFNKEIDPDSVTKNKIYWGESESRYPKSVDVSGNKIIADFSNNPLPGGENKLYVIGIRDYSANKLSEIKDINTISDSIAPEISDFTISADKKVVTVYFNKSVKGGNRESYNILDENGKNLEIQEVEGSGREYKLKLFKSLPLGKNTILIDNVKDSTSNQRIRDFRARLNIKDTENPKMVSHTGYGNNIVVNFSKEMDKETVANPANYIMKFNGDQKKLPSNTSFVLGKDNSSVTILLPETYNGEAIMAGKKGNLTELDITGLKDVYGNDTKPLILNISFDGQSSGKAKATDYYSERPGRQAALVNQNEIKVKFNMPIVYANKNDFSVNRRYISEVVADGTDIVSIHLEEEDLTSIPDRSVRVASDNNMKTYIGTGVESGVISVFDEIAPKIKKDMESLPVYRNEIEIPFTEELEVEGSALYKRDLKITRIEDSKVLSEDDYATSLDTRDNSILIVEVKDSGISSKYSVKITGSYNNGKASYIRDKDGNLAEESVIYTTSDIIR